MVSGVFLRLGIFGVNTGGIEFIYPRNRRIYRKKTGINPAELRLKLGLPRQIEEAD
jgi:hypothetical protein